MEVADNMQDLESAISIKSSWPEVKNTAKDAFSFGNFIKENNDQDAYCEIVPESCVFLLQYENSQDPLTIEISSSDPTIVFNRIHLISEANYIEVYGLFGEYLKTVIGQLLEDVDGTLAFSCLVDDIALSQVSLKFVGLKGAREMWLFGGRVWSSRNENPTVPSSSLNMENIDSRLSEGNCRLSPLADKLKQLITEYISRRRSMDCFESAEGNSSAASDVAKEFIHAHQLAAGQSKQMSPGGNRNYNCSPTPIQQHPANIDFLKTFIDAHQLAGQSKQNSPGDNQNYNCSPPPIQQYPPNFDFIKLFIDSSLQNMENRIVDDLTEQIRELELRQNKRIDHILKLLENSALPSTP